MKEIEKQSELDDILKKAGNKLVVVDFWASWCGPCKIIGREFDKLDNDEKYQNSIILVKCDVDEGSELAEDCEIDCMPTVIFYRQGKMLGRMSGANKARLLEKIAELTESSQEAL